MNKKNIILIVLLTLFGISLGFFITSFNRFYTNNVAPKNKQAEYSGERLAEIQTIDNYNTSSGEFIPEIIETKPYKHTDIKAVYLTGWSAGTKSKRQSTIENLNTYGFNAVVIDIKDEAGKVSYKSNVQTALDTSASQNMIKDIKEVIEDFHNNNIYVIGRIVTFKDPNYAKKIPDIAYKTADGSLWLDYSGNNWPNPYNEASWEYPIALAKEAAELGFDEIQFDYIRFPSSEGRTKNIAFGFDYDTKTKSEVINSFLTHTMNELKDYDVTISADVFGIVTKKRGDFEHIGQDFYEIAKIVDVICPMVYPSHYGPGEYGIKAPDTKPYEIIKASLLDAQKQYLDASGDVKLAKIRPYLQDFTASWLKKGTYITYNTKAVTAQLQACYDIGINDFTLWDPSNKYAYESINQIVTSIQTSGDVISSGDINSGDNISNF